MSIAVDFYAGFTKRLNSTKRPTASPVSINCLLKDSTSITNPVLEIRGSGASFNPRLYTYCHIYDFGRYYFIKDWTYENAVWFCFCEVDVLGSFKIPIGNSTKYILRSSYAHNINIVDELYPVLSWKPNDYYSTASFTLNRYFNSGLYILGIANNTSTAQSAITYYAVTSSEIRQLVLDMLPSSADSWSLNFTGLTDSLYRSIYDPFGYIKSCKWFPINLVDIAVQGIENMKFGNYTSTALGYPIANNIDSWGVRSALVYLPTSWLSLEAKYRTNPYAQLYIVVNPWGVFELNPLDFTDTRTIKLYMYPDLVSGNCMLKIFKVVGSTEYLIMQNNCKFAIDIGLTSAYINAQGLLNGFSNMLSATDNLKNGNALTTLGEDLVGIGNIVGSMIPTIRNSTGSSIENLRTLDGDITLIYSSVYFANEDNSDFGKPLCDTRQINSIPGYILCKDGHIEIETAYKNEIEKIEEFLIGGFFYE